MVYRFLAWLGAGMVTAGVAAGMVAGAGVAVADSPAGSDGSRTTVCRSGSAGDEETKARYFPSGDQPGAMFLPLQR